MAWISDVFTFVIIQPILNVLFLLYHFIGDFGLAIVALTLIVNLVLFPLSYRQLKMVRARRMLASELGELRQRHAKDLLGLRAAEKELFKQRGIVAPSPWLGLIAQAPIFIGLYSALTTVLAQSPLARLNTLIYPFLPQFTSLPGLDLTWLCVVNSAWHISLALPDPTSILSFLTGLLTFVQMRLAQPPTVGGHEAMSQAQQVIQFLIPCVMALITIFITAKFAAGIALYRSTSLLWNIVQQACMTGWGSLFAMPRLAVEGKGISTSQAVQTQMKPVARKASSRRRRGRGRRR